MKRFFHSGDGIIHLKSEKNNKTFSGRYRDENGHYREEAYQAICEVFSAPYFPHQKILSLRLIEFLDLLEDQMGQGNLITITSGYRPPEYNTGLRKKGALAAKASLHQYGMAADLIMEGVSSKRIWHYVRTLEFGGAGYYHGKTVHVDVGPARFWDEKSSGVGTGISDDNKLIGLVTDYDRYPPGARIKLSFIRMTAFPIKVESGFFLISALGGEEIQGRVALKPEKEGEGTSGCSTFADLGQMASLRRRLPADIQPGRYRIRATFCGNDWPQMPTEVVTPEFEIRSP